MFRSTAIFLFFFTALVVTGGLSWLALGNYHSAAPIAQENLRSLALTMASAMEGVATRDPSLKSLISFHSPEMAYAILISTQGEILFHSNADLVGSAMMDSRYQLPLQNGNFDEERIRLGTGEMVYEFQTPIHFANQTCILRLALHTWRADGVMRRAQQEMQIIFSLLIIGWILALVIISLLRKQMWLQRQSARQRELARLGEVGAVLAHEIRNPLAGIKGYAQLLEERLPDGKERDFASLIVNEARRMESLTHDILLYSRSESLVPEPCPLAPVTATVLQLLALQAQEHGVHFFCDIADDLFVLCPREGLQQVILNVLTNSLQACLQGSEDGGDITISGYRQGKWIILRVQDTGPGISAEMEKLLFDPFQTSKARGAGLGLAVCKKIIDRCGGSIEVKNRLKTGAECTICLPAAAASNDGDRQ